MDRARLGGLVDLVSREANPIKRPRRRQGLVGSWGVA